MDGIGGFTPPHILISWILAIVIIVLPGVPTTILMVTGYSRPWYEKWRFVIWFLPLPLGFLILSIIMETLVLTGKLSFLHVASAVMVYTIVMAFMVFRRVDLAELRDSIRWFKYPWIFIPILQIILYMSLTVYPFDFIFDSTDCGVYVTSGINAFKNGSFRFIDPELIQADESFRNAFYLVTPPDKYNSARDFRFEGMMGTGHFIRSFDTGLVEPRYFNLYPLWIGLFVSIFGLLPGVWLTTPFIALCAISGFFLLAWALAGRLTSVLSLGLLSVFVLQVWFGRYLTTEMAFQAALLNALAWMLIFSSDSYSGNEVSRKSAMNMVLAGLMLGMSHFTRIDSVLILFAIAGVVVLWICFAKRLKEYLCFLLSYLIVTSIAIGTAAVVAQSYTLETFCHVNVDIITGTTLAAGLAVIMIGVLICVILRTRATVLQQFFTRNSRVIWSIILLCLCLGLLYGYAVRPVIYPPDYKAFAEGNQSQRSYALPQMTLRWLGWYLTPPALAGAFAGLFLLMYRKWSIHTALTFLVFGIYGLYFTRALHCTPYHYWGMRRFITVLFPALFIGLGYLFREGFIWSRRRKNHLVFGLVLCTLFSTAGFFVWDLRFILRFNHWKGAIDVLKQIDNAVPDNSRLILQFYPGSYLYMPLKVIFDKQVYLIQEKADKNTVNKAVHHWIEKGERVFSLTKDSIERDGTPGFQLIPVIEGNPRFPRMEYFVESKPTRRGAHAFTYYVYEIKLSDDSAGKLNL